MKEWLRRAAGAVTSGASWFGRNVIKPASNFLKQVPVVGDVVSAAGPLGSFVQKGLDNASDRLNRVPPEKRRKGPSFSDAQAALKSGVDTFRAAKSAIPRIAEMAAGY